MKVVGYELLIGDAVWVEVSENLGGDTNPTPMGQKLWRRLLTEWNDNPDSGPSWSFHGKSLTLKRCPLTLWGHVEELIQQPYAWSCTHELFPGNFLVVTSKYAFSDADKRAVAHILPHVVNVEYVAGARFQSEDRTRLIIKASAASGTMPILEKIRELME